MRRDCQHCGTRLRLRDRQCRYCRRAALSWLHRAAIAAAALVAVFYVLKTF